MSVGTAKRLGSPRKVGSTAPYPHPSRPQRSALYVGKHHPLAHRTGRIRAKDASAQRADIISDLRSAACPAQASAETPTATAS